MTEEAVNELTERVAEMTNAVVEGRQVNMTEFQLAVLEVCQMAQGGAGVRPVPCHTVPAKFMRGLVAPGPGILWPIYSDEGMALRLDSAVPPLQRDPPHPDTLLQVNLGRDGGLFLAHELQATAALSAGLAARQRADYSPPERTGGGQ